MATYYFKTSDGRTSKINAASESEAQKRAAKIAADSGLQVSGGISNSKPVATGEVAGVSFAEFGAGGKGEFPSDFDFNSKENKAPTVSPQMKGETNAEYRKRINETPFYLAGGGQNQYKPPRTLSKAESLAIANEYGLKGLGFDNAFAGNTREQAVAKATKLKQERLANTSMLTSYAFDPKTIAGFKDTFKELKLKIDENNNNTWNDPETKKELNDILIKSYNKKLAGLFNSPEDLKQPELQKYLQQYERIGGDINDLSASMATPAPVGPNATGETVPNADGTMPNNQSLDQYLGNLNDPSKQKALESLIPEKEIAQQKIAFEQSIPEKYKEYYFGSEKEIGFLEQQKLQKQEEMKLLDRKAKLDERNAKAQADYLIEKNEAELEVETAQIEQNRLAAKNYMTSVLAKLGALNTSSAAGEAIIVLDQKYQSQSQKLRTAYQFANREIQLGLKEKVDAIQIKRDEDILAIKSDLSKSEEDTWKEIFKLQNTADRETLDIVNKYAVDFRNQTEKYTKEAKEAAEKYAKEFEGIASAYTLGKLSFSEFIRTKQTEAQKSFGDAKIQSLVPEFIQNLINSGSISADLEAVINGDAKLSDYTPTVATKIRREMTKLGLTTDMIKAKTGVPDVEEALKQAKEAIDSGADEDEVRQRFLENYPKNATLYKDYFGN